MGGKAIVIGRGVIGASVALELARGGWDVTAIDRHGAAGHGSTSGSAGVIRTYYSTLAGTAMAWEGRHLWRDFAGHLGVDVPGVAAFRDVGCLLMLEPGGDQMAAQRAHADALGIPYEMWTPKQVRARLPVLDMACFAPPKQLSHEDFGAPTGGQMAGAIHWPCSGYISDPMLAAQNLWDAAARHGAQAMRGEVVGFRSGARVEAAILADGTQVEADIVVNVAGPASKRINALAGVTGDMVRASAPMRQEVVKLPSPAGFDYGADGLILSDNDIGVYVRPDRDGMLVGSQEPACDTMAWVEDERVASRDFSDQWDTQAMRVGQRMPTLGIPRRQTGVVEFYDVSDDWTPIYDRSSLPGFYMACGTSGNQFKNSLVAGRLMAEIIERCENGGDHDTDPVQLDLPHAGRVIDTHHFSRLRGVEAGGPSTVLG